MVKEAGAGARAYGILQSAMWLSQTVLSPLLGAMSDMIGRKQVIFVSLLISLAGCALLGFSRTFEWMLLARIITGSGFQIALFRAYFADTQVEGLGLWRGNGPGKGNGPRNVQNVPG